MPFPTPVDPFRANVLILTDRDTTDRWVGMYIEGVEKMNTTGYQSVTGVDHAILSPRMEDDETLRRAIAHADYVLIDVRGDSESQVFRMAELTMGFPHLPVTYVTGLPKETVQLLTKWINKSDRDGTINRTELTGGDGKDRLAPANIRVRGKGYEYTINVRDGTVDKVVEVKEQDPGLVDGMLRVMQRYHGWVEDHPRAPQHRF